MADDRAAAPSLQYQLALLQELAEAIRQQDRREHAATAETQRLRRAIKGAVVRLQAMVAGQRASRAELQGVIAELRAAVGPGGRC